MRSHSGQHLCGDPHLLFLKTPLLNSQEPIDRLGGEYTVLYEQIEKRSGNRDYGQFGFSLILTSVRSSSHVPPCTRTN